MYVHSSSRRSSNMAELSSSSLVGWGEKKIDTPCATHLLCETTHTLKSRPVSMLKGVCIYTLFTIVCVCVLRNVRKFTSVLKNIT